MKQKAIIVDIDGTLANVNHRRHFVENGNEDWKAFKKATEGDTPNLWCATLVRAMQYQHHDILFVTGRDKEYEKYTEQFIIYSGIQSAKPWALFIREAKDYRKDHVIKKEIYEKYIEPYYDITFVVDDRQSVVDMWRSLGLVCLQCDVGDF